MLLVTDARQPLALGKTPRTAGRAYLQQVQDRTESRFEHVELPFTDYAALEALDAVARQAAELEAGAPASSPLRPRDVMMSHLRRGRLSAHPLLGRLLAGPAAPSPPLPGRADGGEGVTPPSEKSLSPRA